MSAPTPAPGDESPREGYYPDPSIPGYVRYWNGASWVPGTSRPAPPQGEAMPAAPAGRQPGPEQQGSPVPANQVVPSSPAVPSGPVMQTSAPAGSPVEETGPIFLDEEPQPDERPEPATAWQADASRQTGFGGEHDRRVSWGAAPQPGAVPAADSAPGPGPDPRTAGGPAPAGGASADRVPDNRAPAVRAPSDLVPVDPHRPAARPPAAGEAPDVGGGSGQAPENTVTIRPVGRGGRQPASGAPDRGVRAIRGLSPGVGAPDPARHAPGAGPGAAPAQGPVSVPAAAAAQAPAPAAGGPAVVWPQPGRQDVQPEQSAPQPQLPRQQQQPPQPYPSQPQHQQAGPQHVQSPQQPQPQPQQFQQVQQPQLDQQSQPPQRSQPPQANRQPQQAQRPPQIQQPQQSQQPQPQPQLPHQAQQSHPQFGASGGPQPEQPVAPWRPPADDPFQQMAQARAAARPAGLGKRFVARLVDTVVLGALVGAIGFPLVTRALDHIDAKIEAARLSGRTVTVWLVDPTTSGLFGAVLGAFLVLGALLEALPTAKWGRTLGKKLCGLEVRDIESHEAPSFGAALRRWLVYGVLGVLAVGVVNVLWCLFDRPWRQCWHDKAAHTFVAG